MASRSLSREENKLITRRRLLEAAAKVLREEGFEAVTTGRVAREAGVAQPTFYVHFRDMDDLLRTVAQEQMARIREPLREVRKQISSSTSEDLVRETFRLPLRVLLEQPEIFRLYMQEYHRPGSPVGQLAREMQQELQRDLVEDFIALGAPAATESQRKHVEMVAEGVITLTQTLGLGYLDGRYPDLDQIVDVLVRFMMGAISLPIVVTGSVAPDSPKP